MKEPGGATTSYSYDSNGRMATVTRPLGDHTVYTHGSVQPNGDRRPMLNVETITEHPRAGSPEAVASLTRTTMLQYGPANLPTMITAPDGASTIIQRDARGKAKQAWGDATSRVRTFQEDAEDYVRENPTKAVFTALGIGFVLGLIFRR
jgi:YD repeat-containing protein